MLDEVTLDGLPLIGPDSRGISWGLYTLEGWGSPQGTLDTEQRARAHGSWAGEQWLEARSLSLEGEALLPSADLAVQAQDALIAAVSLSGAELAVTEGGTTRTLTVRRDGEVMIEWSPSRPLTFEWSVQVVALDPRKRGQAVTASTALPSTTGGLSIPFEVPFSIDAVTVSGQCSLTNPGNTTGPMRLRIDGPIVAPVVTHVASGKSLVFASSLSLGAGEFLIVDMESQRVLAQGIEPRDGWITRDEFFGFEPGVNVLAFAAAGGGSGTLTAEGEPCWQ